jgi:hypothetical protein
VRQCFIEAQSERDKTVCVSSQTTKKGESSQNENRELKSYFRNLQCSDVLATRTDDLDKAIRSATARRRF